MKKPSSHATSLKMPPTPQSFTRTAWLGMGQEFGDGNK